MGAGSGNAGSADSPQQQAFIKKFVEMGFAEDQVKGIIVACEGNLESAAQMLLPN